MNSQMITSRQTKYCTDIENILSKLGHATNLELLNELRITYPELSATTVHRATARLSERGKISIAPKNHDGSMRYDYNTKPHDHFMCSECGILRDADVKDKVKTVLQENLEGCQVSGRLTISGICKKCSINKKENI